MERTVRVTGRGRLSVKPDTTRLLLTLEGVQKEYSETLRLSSEMTDCLKTALETLGFDRKEVRTLRFGVDKKTRGYRDKDGNWRETFAGYRFSHRMKVEFPSDNARLGRILYALAHCDARPEMDFEYTVADPETVKNELLAKAVADSRAKAAVLAGAAGVTLGDILTVDYSWGELEFVTRPMEDLECCKMAPTGGTGSFNMDIEADDIDVTDTVTVVWGIG